MKKQGTGGLKKRKGVALLRFYGNPLLDRRLTKKNLFSLT